MIYIRAVIVMQHVDRNLDVIIDEFCEVAQNFTENNKRAIVPMFFTEWQPTNQYIVFRKNTNIDTISNLVRAMWIFSGCRNIHQFSFLSPSRMLPQSFRRIEGFDGFASVEQNFRMNERTPFMLRHASCAPIDLFGLSQLSLVLTGRREQGKICGNIIAEGGDILHLVCVLLPSLTIFLNQLAKQHDVPLGTFVIAMSNVSVDPSELTMIQDTNPSIEGGYDDIFLGATANDFFEAFDNGGTIGGNFVCRRVLKPLIMAAKIREEGENARDLILQLPDGKTKETLQKAC